MGLSSSVPAEAAPAERAEDRGWCSWLLCGAPSLTSRNEDDVEKGEAEPLRSALEEKEQQLRQNSMREKEVNRQIQQLRSALEQKDSELRHSTKKANRAEETQEQLRSALEEAEELTQRLDELKQENHQLRSALEQRESELRQSTKRAEQELKEKGQQQENLRLKDQEEFNRRIRVLEKAQEDHLRSVKQTEKDLSERLSRLHQENQQLRSALGQKEDELRLSTESSRSTSCQRCELQAQELRHTLSEMEAFYKDKLTEARSALKEKEEQLRSFKDRVAQNVVLSLKTENTENMNSPVNQSRLTEMYQQLRVCTWPNIHFSSSDAQARALVQDMFRAAAEHMKTVTETACGGQTASVKVEKFRQTALENLQLALFHSSRADVFKAAFPQFQVSPEDQLLASECYWLGCLMALNSPPLHPDWDSTDEQSGTVFPRELQSQRRQNN